MKYLIEPRPRGNVVNPVCSARGDASAILQAEGYVPLYIGDPKRPKLVRNAVALLDLARLRLTLKPGDTLFMQWPPDVPGASLLVKMLTPPS